MALDRMEVRPEPSRLIGWVYRSFRNRLGWRAVGIFGRKRKREETGERHVAVPRDQLEQWIDEMTDEVEAMYPGSPSPEMMSALSRAAFYAIHMTTPVTQDESDTAMSIALTGYLFREREMDILRDHDASQVFDSLVSLRESNPQWDTWPRAAAGAAGMLAWADAPDNKDRAASLGVLSCGLEGRRLASQTFVLGMRPSPDEQGSVEDKDFYRAWRFGYYLRCFEAGLAEDSQLD